MVLMKDNAGEKYALYCHKRNIRGKQPLAYKIVLDAGHGGGDPGAVYQGRQEKDDTLTLTMAVGEILEETGLNVVYTRTEDIYQDSV